MRSPRILGATAVRRLFGPLVPARQKLPFSFFLAHLSGNCEPELLHLDDFIDGARTAIDVGANNGLYTLALAKRFARVVAFEINEKITEVIRHYNRGNIELIHCGLSSEPGESRLFIPVSHGVVMAGWASLNRDNLPGAEKLIEIEAKLKRLDDFELKNVDFIKIDVEGHEVEVLKGAAKTVEAGRPIVLVELKKEHVQEVDAWFKQLEYKHCRLEDFGDARGHRSNHIYVPVEKLAKFGIARPTD